jgi:hypothetical protein
LTEKRVWLLLSTGQNIVISHFLLQVSLDKKIFNFSAPCISLICCSVLEIFS